MCFLFAIKIVISKEGKVCLPDKSSLLRCEKLEGNTQKQKNPHDPNSLAFATWVIARLGGWRGLKSQRPLGIKTISKGLLKFYNLKSAISFFGNVIFQLL